MYIGLILSALLVICIAKPAIEPDTKAEASNNDITDEKKEFLKSYAEKMLSYMNLTVAPCDDFYEYACGNWKLVKPEADFTDKLSSVKEILLTLIDKIDQLLMTKSSLASDLGYANEFHIVQQFYNACLSANLYPMPAADPAYLSLIRSIGGFPAVDGDAWQASNFSWFNMSAHLTNYGGMGLINEHILPHYPFVPYFELPELGFDCIVHSDNIASNDTYGYKQNEKRMRGYLKTYGLSDDKVDEAIAAVFAFWREALQVTDRFEEDYAKCYALSQSMSLSPFPMRNYFEIAWRNISFDGFKVIPHCAFYYHEIDKVCVKHKKAVANYLAMKLLFAMDSKLKSTKFQRIYCGRKFMLSSIFILNKLYLLEHFTEETKSDIERIVVELRKSFVSIVENANWIDDETREQALLKESSIKARIGSLKDDNTTDILIRQLNKLIFVPGNYATNNINLNQFHIYMKRFQGIHHKQLSDQTKPMELLNGLEVNAMYFLFDNSINVMAGILHPPAYHPAWPDSLKFGTIGYFVGHELTHGFDTTGSQFDSHGNLRDWWTKKSRMTFSDRSKCFVDHFSKYMIPGINRQIIGNLTKNENIADNGGLYESMNAYRNHMKQLIRNENSTTKVPRSEQMPGMDLSPEQLFFVGFAQLYCSEYEEEDYWNEQTEGHTIDKYRVLGAVSNNEDFAQAYNCPKGSPMNPNVSKCRVW